MVTILPEVMQMAGILDCLGKGIYWSWKLPFGRYLSLLFMKDRTGSC